MSSEKVARLLTDFDRQEPQKGRSRVVPFDHAQHSNPKMQPKPPVPSAQRRMMRTSAGDPRATPPRAAEYEQKLNDETEQVRARLAEERDKLLNETAAKIASDIAEIGNQLETKIAGVTARVLEPFISSAVQKQAVASFVEKLSSLTADARRPTLSNNGPIRIAGAGAEQARRPLDRSRTSCRAGALRFHHRR